MPGAPAIIRGGAEARIARKPSMRWAGDPALANDPATP